ncbi:Bug family tripartite tricarboxylate transporter substrate binding protein [Sabulicella rubraurantiaca]|uniref:Bug family tripartite tricarboxylate transporter substrate binding protein n=1 Tax=Sabulicella rubraurantiaca TaxID=2811429 RepID=UPI001A961A11|nr:tripartite tricarboxylate transporter substrate binding protein [Sabulicella rubraurantiaca]
MIGRRLLLTLAPIAAAQAQEARYPNRPIRVIVALGAGGDSDLVRRVVTQRMAQTLGQPIVVENRPGAGSIVGHEAVARATPDGYTLIQGSITALTANAALYPRLPYDPETDFQPIVFIASTPGILVAPGSNTWNTPADLVTAAKARPGQLTFGSAGNGNLTHLMAEVFRRATGIDVVHVPYRTVTDAQRDLAAGRVDFMFAVAPSTLPLVQGGQLKPLAITARARLPQLPQVPTMTELGYPDFEVSSWFGLLGPRGTPPEVVTAINAAANEALRDPAVLERLAQMSVTPGGGTPQDFEAFIGRERVQWIGVVRSAGIRLE